MLNWYLFGSLKITSTHTFAFCLGGGYLISEFAAHSQSSLMTIILFRLIRVNNISQDDILFSSSRTWNI